MRHALVCISVAFAVPAAALPQDTNTAVRDALRKLARADGAAFDALPLEPSVARRGRRARPRRSTRSRAR